jgi:diguanylate cyclase (GGDEF)-like protein/PAS domain S-box-containing protein
LNGHEVPFPSLADGFYLTASILPVAGTMLVISGRVSGLQHLRAGVEGVLIGFALFFVLGAVLETAVSQARDLSLVARCLAVAYPVLDLLVLTVVLSTLVNAGVRPELRRLAAAFAAMTIADLLFAYQVTIHSYERLFLPDLGWMAAFALLASAAIAARPQPAGPNRQLGYGKWLVYVSLGAATTVGAIQMLVHGTLTRTESVIVTALTLLAVVRQIAGQAENRTLTDRLEREVARATATSARFLAVFEGSRDALLLLDRDHRVLESNRAAEILFRADQRPLEGRRLDLLVHPHDVDAVVTYIGAIVAGVEQSEVRFRIVATDGAVVSVEATGADLLGDPAVSAVALSLHDITQRLAREGALAQAEARFRAAFAHAPIGVALCDGDARIVEVNTAFALMMGLDSAHLTGQSLGDLMHPDDWDRLLVPHRAEQGAGRVELITSGRAIESRYLRPDGRVVWGLLAISRVPRQTESDLLIVQVQDISDGKAIAQRMAHDAEHDKMTGLANRSKFLLVAAEALAEANITGEHLATLFIDLDRFKAINDSLGHQAGDIVLQTVAQRLLGAVRPADLVARLGGDEFTVLLRGVGADRALEAAQRIADAIRQPIELPDGETIITGSIGVSIAAPGTPPEMAEHLLRDADLAMYRAKETGRARVALFDETPAPNPRVSRVRVVTDLHRAIERDELRVFYQPLVDLRSGLVTGCEALVRWQHPERGLLPPSEFVEIAEDTGLILPIGQAVLEMACVQLGRWNAARAETGRSPLTMNVNLSARQLDDPALGQRVESTIFRTGVPADLVWLEITESALMRETSTAISTLRELRRIGVHLAIDDFGTGYSSLAYLKRFPVEALKIDRSFTDGLGTDPEDTTIVDAVISLAHALGLEAVAEGLETHEQLAELRRLGCDHAQGYLFGRPAPADVLGLYPADDLSVWQK